MGRVGSTRWATWFPSAKMAKPKEEYSPLVLPEEAPPSSLARLEGVSSVAILFSWQILSLVLTSTGVFSEFLSLNGFNAPTMQSMGNYLMLTIYAARLKWQGRPFRIPWYTCLMVALADIEGNY